MIIPEYWAEARRKVRTPKKQITVRRFGWSDESQQAAQEHADARAEEALQLAIRDARTPRRDPKVPYNGGVGLPIREEVLDRSERYVITRNSYGALCLNTPDVLFADIDLASPSYYLLVAFLGCVSIAIAVYLASGSAILAVGLGVGLYALYYNLRKASVRRIEASGRLSREELSRIELRWQQFSDWSLRIYRTPAGFRILVTHRTFDPNDREVARFFQTFHVDYVYRLMCQNQHCFRARLTAKPWRIGLTDRMRPRPGVWPVHPEHLAARQAWIQKYQAIAKDYAACEYVKTLGSDHVHPLVQPVLEIHDRLAQVNSGRSLA